MQLVEIIVGEKTDDQALAKAFDYVLAIGKVPIVVNDSPRILHVARVRNLDQRRHVDAAGRPASAFDRNGWDPSRHADRTAGADG